MSNEASQAEQEIDDKFRDHLKAHRKRSMVFPVFLTVVFGGSVLIGVWDLFSGRGLDAVERILDGGFVIMMSWLLWDVTSRLQILKCKYQTAAGLLDQLVKNHGWTWKKDPEPGSVCLLAPGESEDAAVITEK